MKPALHSVSYCGFWGQDSLSLEEFIPHAAKLGYSGISIVAKKPHACVLNMTKERLQKVAKLLVENRVECASIAAYTDFSNAFYEGMPINEMQTAYVVQCAEMAKALNCQLVRVFTAYEHHTNNWKGLWKQVVSILQECSDRVAPLGITLAVQNHHDLAVATDAMFELLTEVGRPNCRAGFDAWSPALNGEDLYKSALKMAHLTVLTTCADYVRLPRYRYIPALTNFESAGPDLVQAVTFGEGFIDYRSFFKGLNDGGYDGWALYEMCEKLRGGGGMENLDRCAGKFVDYIKALK